MRKVIFLMGGVGSGNTTLYNALLETGKYDGIDLMELRYNVQDPRFKDKLERVIMQAARTDKKCLVIDNVVNCVLMGRKHAQRFCDFLNLFSERGYNMEIIINPQSKLIELEDSNKK